MGNILLDTERARAILEEENIDVLIAIARRTSATSAGYVDCSNTVMFVNTPPSLF